MEYSDRIVYVYRVANDYLLHVVSVGKRIARPILQQLVDDLSAKLH